MLSKAAALGGDVAGVIAGSGVRDLAAQAGEHGAARVYVADDPALAAPLPQPRVDVLASLVTDKGFDTVLFGQSVLAADLAAGLAARLDAGLNWDLTDIAARGRQARRQRGPRSRDSVVVDVGWTSEPRLALVPHGRVRPGTDGRQRRGRGRRRSRCRTSRPAP